MKKDIIKYEIAYTMEMPDYFQGYGISFTKWDDVKIGSGCTLSEAFQDCFTQIAEDYNLTDDMETKILDEVKTSANMNLVAYESHEYFVGIFIKVN